MPTIICLGLNVIESAAHCKKKYCMDTTPEMNAHRKSLGIYPRKGSNVEKYNNYEGVSHSLKKSAVLAAFGFFFNPYDPRPRVPTAAAHCTIEDRHVLQSRDAPLT